MGQCSKHERKGKQSKGNGQLKDTPAENEPVSDKGRMGHMVLTSIQGMSGVGQNSRMKPSWDPGLDYCWQYGGGSNSGSGRMLGVATDPQAEVSTESSIGTQKERPNFPTTLKAQSHVSTEMHCLPYP